MSLDPATITALMAATRDRGGNERYIRKFIASGELAEVVTDNLAFKAKNRDSIKNGLTQARKAIEGAVDTVRVVHDKENDAVVIINMVVYNELQNAA